MIVCIAEKPSVARDIARILGATKQCEGYLEGNGYQVTLTLLRRTQDACDVACDARFLCYTYNHLWSNFSFALCGFE